MLTAIITTVNVVSYYFITIKLKQQFSLVCAMGKLMNLRKSFAELLDNVSQNKIALHSTPGKLCCAKMLCMAIKIAYTGVEDLYEEYRIETHQQTYGMTEKKTYWILYAVCNWN